MFKKMSMLNKYLSGTLKLMFIDELASISAECNSAPFPILSLPKNLKRIEAICLNICIVKKKTKSLTLLFSKSLENDFFSSKIIPLSRSHNYS